MDRHEIEGNIAMIKVRLSELNLDMVFRDSTGKYSITKCKPKHNKFIEILDIISNNIDEIGLRTLTEFQNLVYAYLDFLNKIIRYDDIQFVNRRSETLSEYNNFYESLKEIWQLVAAVISDSSGPQIDQLDTIQKNLELLDEKNRQLNDRLEETETLKNSLKAQVEDYRDATSDLSVKKELLDQSKIFNEAAERNKSNSSWWLAGVILSSIFLFVLVLCLKHNFCFDISCYEPNMLSQYNKICDDCGEHILWLEIFKSLFFRLLLISLNIYLITFCVRNYNACMHNKVINEHRHNSFASAFHFFNNTTSERKDEILIRAADAIFTYQKTGYYGKDSEPANPSIIQNVVEKVTGKS